MDYLIQDNTLTGIADGVRDISGETENLSPAQMTTELGNAGDEVDDQNGILQTLIQTIESKQKGDADLIEKTVNANGIYNASADNADGYSKVVVDVPSSGTVPSVSKGVRFIDYDGSIVDAWDVSDVAGKTALPNNLTHEGLTAQGWNWSLANIKSYIASYPDSLVTVGQMYITDDGKTRIYIHLEEGRLSPYLGICPNGSVDVDWGDGTTHSTVSGSSTSTVVNTQHTYAHGGDYVIKLTVSGTMGIVGNSTYGSQLLWKNKTTGDLNRVYQNAIQRVEIGNSVTSIGYDAFNSCYSLASVTIPNSVTSIGEYAFHYCNSFASVTIPDSVTSISGYAFDYCVSLVSVTIPNSVTSIRGYAFDYCVSLVSVTIPNSVTSIGEYAFYYCNSLASVTIPNSVTSIGSSAFSVCYSIISITIPNSVTSIGSMVFTVCNSLKSVTIPNSVTSIGAYAFQSCVSLKSVTIPNSVTSISVNAFDTCYCLSSITIPNSVTSISRSVFYCCYSLASVTIPDSVTSIGSEAFSKCYSLGAIKFMGATPPTVSNSNAWDSVPTDCVIYVPNASLSTYKSATNYPSSSKYTYIGY